MKILKSLIIMFFLVDNLWKIILEKLIIKAFKESYLSYNIGSKCNDVDKYIYQITSMFNREIFIIFMTNSVDTECFVLSCLGRY